ncbi:uncharacterized protein N7483_002342 [Penicillium malachiteum]|uniref:uncharacterized protein n=1 Tax=Penicillium malachiteum TaxID=1324776 RepID=UPI002547F13A|nr:uncharacterized protein N7483_002342 [Penicillium malachiteum]KAJ5737217.1 hypothetical protein N7483_002342 [Penicillium malachiteum]
MYMCALWPFLAGKDQSLGCSGLFPNLTENEEMWYNLNKLVAHWRDELGLTEEGWVRTEQYDFAAERNKSLSGVCQRGGV